MNNLEKLFENVISESALSDYFRLYGELTTEIGIFYDKLAGWKAALRLIEANNNTILLENIYEEINISINRIREIISEMREKEKDLIFAAGVSEDNILTNHINFTRAYMILKAEALRNITNSNNRLIQVKTDVISQIKKVDKRNSLLNIWNTYKTDINEFSTDLNYIDNGIQKYMEEVDRKFHINMLEIINSEK